MRAIKHQYLNNDAFCDNAVNTDQSFTELPCWKMTLGLKKKNPSYLWMKTGSKLFQHVWDHHWFQTSCCKLMSQHDLDVLLLIWLTLWSVSVCVSAGEDVCESIMWAKGDENIANAYTAFVTPALLHRFRVTKCEKGARERRTLLISDSNGSAPTSPTETQPKSRTTSESQPVGILETPPPLCWYSLLMLCFK